MGQIDSGQYCVASKIEMVNKQLRPSPLDQGMAVKYTLNMVMGLAFGGTNHKRDGTGAIGIPSAHTNHDDGKRDGLIFYGLSD